MSATMVLFPLGMRLTTWICVAAFVAVAVRRRDSRPLLAGWVWLLGFEAAFDVSRAATGHNLQWQTRSLPVIVGALTVAWMFRYGIRPDRRWLLFTVAVWVVWLASGFNANQHTMADWSWTAEILNVTAKTALAAAYFVPLVVRRSDRLPEKDAARLTGDAAPTDLRA